MGYRRRNRLDRLCPIPEKSVKGRQVKMSHNALRDNGLRQGKSTGCRNITVRNPNNSREIMGVYKCKSQGEYNRLMKRSAGISSSMKHFEEYRDLEKRVSLPNNKIFIQYKESQIPIKLSPEQVGRYNKLSR